MTLLDGMIQTGRLCSFVDELIDIHNEEKKEKTLWEFWLHRVFDKSYTDFMDSVDGKHKAQPTAEETAAIVKESMGILGNLNMVE